MPCRACCLEPVKAHSIEKGKRVKRSCAGPYHGWRWLAPLTVLRAGVAAPTEVDVPYGAIPLQSLDRRLLAVAGCQVLSQ
jgi:hypothetical protein